MLVRNFKALLIKSFTIYIDNKMTFESKPKILERYFFAKKDIIRTDHIFELKRQNFEALGAKKKLRSKSMQKEPK